MSQRKRERIQHPAIGHTAPEGENSVGRLLALLQNGGIHNETVLKAIETIPRDMFVEEPFSGHAWDDTALPIACGQTISQPTVVAWMTAALELTPMMRVLEIGTGSGYQAAILAKLSRRVYTIERHKNLLTQAEARFKTLKFTNIVTKRGDGSKGWKEAAPFERIIVTAAAAEIPGGLLKQLAPGGIMVLPVGSDPAGQVLLRVHKDKNGAITTENLLKVRFVPLIEG